MKHQAFISIIFICTQILAACTSSKSNITTPVPTVIPTVTKPLEISGRVVDTNGLPISQAKAATESETDLTDTEGWFHLKSTGIPQWVTVTKDGYISRTRAADPTVPVLFRISPDDGKTIVINFGGDVMFGRRFFDPNQDGAPSDGLLPTNPSVSDHLNLLKPIMPLLKNSDVTAVNLESVLDNEPYFSPLATRPSSYHPTKAFVYATHPNAITALKQAGVTVIGIGNNHVYDMLESGMQNTLAILDKAGVAHFGAGMNEAEAWAPAIVNIKDQKIAFVGCTTIADSGGTTTNEITYVASDIQKKGGAAQCEPNKLKSAVTQAKQMADVVVVMIHGGFEYDRSPAGNPIRFSEIAQQAGATLVVNHHTHVVSGFTWSNSALTAWSLGNFISDQEVWPAFESYMLSVYLRDGKVARALTEPVMLENFVARGITANLADFVARGAAGRLSGPFVVENGEMEVDVNNTAFHSSKTISLDGGSGTIISIPQAQWLSEFSGPGNLLLGRDLLWVGGFENSVVGNAHGTLPLWKQSAASNLVAGSDFAYSGNVGIELSRVSSNQTDAITTNLHRIPVNPGDTLTVSGMYRGSKDAIISLQVSWYPDMLGGSNRQDLEALEVKTPGVWQPFKLDFKAPPGAVALQAFLRLSPPISGASTADFDNVHVIKWAPTGTPYSVLYNFAYLIGKGDLTFSQAVLPGGEPWLTVSKLKPDELVPNPAP